MVECRYGCPSGNSASRWRTEPGRKGCCRSGASRSGRCPLGVETLLGERAQDVAHALAFEEQRAFQRRRGHGLEIVGAVEPGGAVPVGRADVPQHLGQVRDVLRPVEQHDVLEQVGEAGLSLGLVLGAHIVPGGHGDHRRLAVGVDHHPQAVRHGELLMGDVHPANELGHRGDRGRSRGRGPSRLGQHRGRGGGEQQGAKQSGQTHRRNPQACGP
jgi:hypothetical protein